ncbi:MAG: nuclear transport factor 2 family protein [Novosphingobium sp.]|nr:nuclear transport factor 2 family protein [Novosphingobium sp.]
MCRILLMTAAALTLAAAAPGRAQDAAARLDELDSRITRLEDLNAIERLQRTYGYFVDKAEWDPLGDLFSKDATLEIGGRGIYAGKDHVLAYMRTGFGADGPQADRLMNHMQFQPIPDIDPDGIHAHQRMRAFVMSGGGWGLPLYENDYVKEGGVWKIAELRGPFTMYAGWEDGWKDHVIANNWPGDRNMAPPDRAPTVVFLMYPSYYIVPYHYPNPVTGTPYVVPMAPAGVLDGPPPGH